MRFADARIPELFCGFKRDGRFNSGPGEYLVSCSPQAWGAGSLFHFLQVLAGVQPELWHHQGCHHPQKWLSKFATYEPGEGYNPAARAGDPENTRAFHSGRWVAKAAGDDPEETVQP